MKPKIIYLEKKSLTPRKIRKERRKKKRQVASIRNNGQDIIKIPINTEKKMREHYRQLLHYYTNSDEMDKFLE